MSNTFQEYLNNYDNFKKIIVFDFQLGYGGIGDLIKYFMYILDICIKYDIKLHYMRNNILIEHFLLLKHNKMYINIETCLLHDIIYIRDQKNIPIPNILDNKYYIVSPQLFYDTFSYNNISILVQEVFFFSEEVILNSSNLLKTCNINNNYISIHVRLGDKFIETDSSFKACPEDTRTYSEEKLYNFIDCNFNKNIILFSDNNNIKIKIKNKYNNINIIKTNIGHSSFKNTTYEQVLDTVTEFYILTNSEHIYITAYSGFSFVASKFNNIPFSSIPL